MNKKTIIIIVAIIAAILLFGSAGGSNSSDGLSVYLVTDFGGIDDGSFNESSYAGVTKFAEEFGADANYLESEGEDMLIGNMTAAVDAGADVIVTPGFVFQGKLEEVALANPETKFILLDAEPIDEDGNPTQIDNIASFLFKEHQSGYLAGIAAAHVTETNKLGFVGGIPVPAVQNFGSGYIQGAKSVNPDITVDVQFVNNFDNVASGTQTTEAMINNDVDVIFTSAGPVGNGSMSAVEAARNEGKNVWHVGVDVDQFAENENVNIFSAGKNLTGATYETLKALNSGDESSFGTTTILGASEYGVQLFRENPLYDALENKDEIEAALSEADLESVQDFTTAPIEDGKY